MKKNLLRFMMLLTVVTTSFAFASCSDDDDDGYSIIGTWKSSDYYYWDGEADIYEFKSNGTGAETSSDYGFYNTFVWTTLSKDDKTMVIRIDFGYTYEMWHITWKSSSSIWVEEKEDTYTRQ